MEKIIVYPFEPYALSNKRTYVRAVQLARQIGAKLILFTAVPEQFNEEDLDGVYLHLLELDGYYQRAVNQWTGRVDIQIQRVIQIGELTERLREWLRWRPADYLICQPHSLTLNGQTLRNRLSPVLLPQLIGES